MDTEPLERVPGKIKYLLRTNGITVHELSDKLALPLENLMDILDGCEIPTPNLLRRIGMIFGVDETFFSGTLGPTAEASIAEDRKVPAPPAGPSRRSDGGEAPRKDAKPAKGARKLDLAEIAARQHALVEILIAKGTFTRDEWDTRLEILRAKVIARKKTVTRTR